MRGDKKKNLTKVATVAIKSPLLTEREIAEEAGVSNGTAHNMLTELEQTGAKDPRIIAITDKDLNIVDIGQEEILKRMQNLAELAKMRTIEIAQVIKESTSRYTIFRGDMTDKDGGLKQTKVTEEEAINLLKLLGK